MLWQKLIKYFYSLVKTEGPHVWGQCFQSCFTFVLCHWSLTWHCIWPNNKWLVLEAAAAPKMVSPALSSYVFCLRQTSDCLKINFKDSVISALHSPLVWTHSPITPIWKKRVFLKITIKFHKTWLLPGERSPGDDSCWMTCCWGSWVPLQSLLDPRGVAVLQGHSVCLPLALLCGDMCWQCWAWGCVQAPFLTWCRLVFAQSTIHWWVWISKLQWCLYCHCF